MFAHYRPLFLFFFLLAVTGKSHAQDIGWNVHFHGFADNREYAKSNRYSQSILGVRIAPEINLSMDSIHFLHGGVNFLHEFGSAETTAKDIIPTIYYNYKQKGHDFYIGMFPRKDLLNGYHRALLNDTLNYYRPNIEGMLWRYQNSAFHQQLWIDWTSRQTETAREQFMVGLSGRVDMNFLYLSHNVTLWHDAGRKNNTDENERPVRDNGAAMAKLGTDLSGLSFLDSLDISAGGIIAYDRLRGIYGWRTPKGFIADVYAEYRKIFIANTFYKGEKLDIAYGDRFYTADFYDRLELGWKPLQYKGLEGKFTLSFHFTRGAIDNQQQFSLQYNLGRLYTRRP
ncbi:hypothetical protein [Parapedobacter koreensis]|uniref:Phosphate-selective porin O and P n=1 Tax=Parapedobacter koreensis TaxID=332977 RepID=A0A1H7M6F7_9SPHI|nr:hypothetical protein [Parapedobacter koreensis]SEL06335.1 hypothetical protein SAMN05421740_103369 [Parapedobacter koreensis]